MGHIVKKSVLIAALCAIPALALGAQQPAPQTKQPAQTKQATSQTKAAPKAKAPATHATSGVVKSVDANSLVITRSGKKGGDMTFALNASTKREGAIESGAHVSVRYTQEGSTMTATAVTARAAKPVAKKK